MDKKAARLLLNLPGTKKLILMGADGGVQNPRKGGDLLFDAIEKVAETGEEDIELLIFGQAAPAEAKPLPYPVHWLGRVQDDRILAMAYNAADVMVVPSRQEAFGLTAQEAMACGTPVVAFEIGGLPDIVEHQQNGWLAKPFDTGDMAAGISWIIENSDTQKWLGENGRKIVAERFSPQSVGIKYEQVYQRLLNAHQASMEI
jgi:glycosyltransferase involved in cell wall biosynthesis